MNDIIFPGLGIHLKDVPISFNVFGFEVALYGLVIAIGMFLAVTLISKLSVKEGYSADTFFDLTMIAIVFGIIGARVYYVIFSWNYYKDHLGEILNLRKGGLGIYGGILLGIVAVYVFTRIKKIDFLSAVDIMIIGVPLGQMMGRWGNFFNREAFGDYSSGIFRMEIPLEMVRSQDVTDQIRNHLIEKNGLTWISVHPTFLYESFLCLIILLILIFYLGKRKYKGEVFFLYNILYGVGRFIIEGLRTDQLVIGSTGIPISQVVAVCLILGGLFGLYLTRQRKWIVKREA